MIILKATTETLQVTTGSAAAVDYSVSYVDITTTGVSPSTNEGSMTTATTTTILSAPAASTQRQIKLVTISNRDATLSSPIVIQKSISGATYTLAPSMTLLAGETVQYMDGEGWVYYATTGAVKGSQTAAGGNMQLQFNNNGILTGDPDLTWNAATSTLALGNNPQIVLGGSTSTPAVPTASTLQLYAQPIAGKMELMKQGPSGDDEALQAALWQNNVVLWTPGAPAGVYQGTAGVNAGSAATTLPTSTNLYTAMRRSTFSTVATTTNQQVGIRTEPMFFRGAVAGMGGFLFVCRFGLTNGGASTRIFVGLTAATSSIVTVQPSTVANSIGFCLEAGDTALTFLHTDNSATSTKDPISNQPALNNNNGYDAYIYCRPNDSTIYYRLDDVLTGNVLVDTSTTTTLPDSSTMLTAQCVVSNGTTTTAGAAAVGINRLYVETNR